MAYLAHPVPAPMHMLLLLTLGETQEAVCDTLSRSHGSVFNHVLLGYLTKVYEVRELCALPLNGRFVVESLIEIKLQHRPAFGARL